MKSRRSKSTKGLSANEIIDRIEANLAVVNAARKRRAEEAGEPVPTALVPPERVVINSGVTVITKSLSDGRNVKQTTTYEFHAPERNGVRNRYQRADGWTVVYDSNAELRKKWRWLQDQMKQLDREQRALLSERRKIARQPLSPTVVVAAEVIENALPPKRRVPLPRLTGRPSKGTTRKLN